MLKKIFFVLIFFLSFFLNNVFAADETYKQKYDTAKTNLDNAQKNYNTCSSSECDTAKSELNTAKNNYDTAKENYDNSVEADWDVTSRWFQINVNSISPWMDVSWWSAKENVDDALTKIIWTLTVFIWSAALLIMTVGAGYMVLHHWQDELLSKWKTIFMSWVYALVVALGSYYLVAILRFILFN